MNLWVIPCIVSAGASLIFAALLLRKRTDSPIFSPLILIMGVLAWIYSLNALIYLQPQELLFWKELVLLGELAFPVALAFVSQSFLKNLAVQQSSLQTGFWKVIAGGGLIIGVWLIWGEEGVLQINSEGEVVFNRIAGLGIWGFILTSLVVGLSQLEQILRASRDPLRFQLKYILIGLGGLAGIAIAQASQLLLLPVWKQTYVGFAGVAVFLSLLLMGFGLGRWQIKDFSQKIQMSHHALYTSVTFLFVGGYLILVGLVTELIQQTGWEMGEAIGALILFIGVLGLVIVLYSRAARAKLQELVARHFFRSRYDYREKWLEATKVFSACQDKEQIWDQLLEWLARTFGAPWVTIWKRLEVDGSFHQIRSVNTVQPSSPLKHSHKLVQNIQQENAPFFLTDEDKNLENLEEFLFATRVDICVPLGTPEGRVLGFCTLSKDLNDRQYDEDDFDLLRAIAHHVTMLLVQFELVEERSVAAKWEAVHRFSGFYLHDLKNLASSLSMVVQNAEQYGHDPEFQESAMRTVRNTSQRIMDLMAKIARQSKSLGESGSQSRNAVNMNQLIKETLQGMNGSGCKPTFHPGNNLPDIRLQEDSIKQVVLNLVLNARQAMRENGTIDISTGYDGKAVSLDIVDSGPGMSTQQMEQVFQPFKSSKKGGLGVGLFQCKQMIEDHQGTIRIESQVGKGTRVSITFPVPETDKN